MSSIELGKAASLLVGPDRVGLGWVGLSCCFELGWVGLAWLGLGGGVSERACVGGGLEEKVRVAVSQSPRSEIGG